MRILLTGGSGQLGWELRRTLGPIGDVEAPERSALDLRDPDRIRTVVRGTAPELIVNAAAYTAVDRAEEEPDVARAVNAAAPAVLAEEARDLGAPLVHFSTDYVFDGETETPYTEDDSPHPLSVYGRTKREGETAVRSAGIPHLVLRTSWVYGARRRNFLTVMLEQLRTRDVAWGTSDQVGSPTWCRCLAEATTAILVRLGAARRSRIGGLEERGGLYHLASPDEATRHAFAAEILDVVASRDEDGLRAREVREASASDFEAAAARPRFSALDSGRVESAFGVRLAPWRDQLRLCLEES